MRVSNNLSLNPGSREGFYGSKSKALPEPAEVRAGFRVCHLDNGVVLRAEHPNTHALNNGTQLKRFNISHGHAAVPPYHLLHKE